MIYHIKTANNGVILEYSPDETGLDAATEVFETDDASDSEIQARQRFLYTLMEHLGWLGGRYDSQRLRISIEPGDKASESGA